MKAIICFAKGGVHIHSFTEQWTPCQCGNVKAKWLDPQAGTVVVAAHNKATVRLLGMNNAYLIPAIAPSGESLSWEEYQKLHTDAVEAPNYLFDKSRIACWAAVVKIGRSNDVRWSTEDEYLEAFSSKEGDVQ